MTGDEFNVNHNLETDLGIKTIKSFRRESGLEAVVMKRPAFDCVEGFCASPNCKYQISKRRGDNHGRSTAQYFYLLKGEPLTLVFNFYSDELHPASTPLNPELKEIYPGISSIGWHSPINWDDDDEFSSLMHEKNCCFMTESQRMDCYFDVTYSGSNYAMQVYRDLGVSELWECLEIYYKNIVKDIMKSINRNIRNRQSLVLSENSLWIF